MIVEKIENAKAVFPKSIGDIFGAKGDAKKLTMKAYFREDSKFVTFFYENSRGEMKDVSLRPGDQLNFCYIVDFDFLKHIPVDANVFPIELEFNEHSYRLNKTKNGKLILTK